MQFLKRRAKIVATLGPSTDHPHVLERMIRAGMDVARFNMSHGTREDHRRRMLMVRRFSMELNKPVALLLDLQGPKIRTGSLKEDCPIHLVKNRTIRITTRKCEGDISLISTSYPHLISDVKLGEKILLDDGKIRLEVLSKSKSTINCKIVHGGWLRPKTGMNLPSSRLSSPALTKKDIEDVHFGIKEEVDAIALSFVRRAKDILQLKSLLGKKKFFVPVIAKIERAEALDHLEEILKVSEGVMVARGDLGVEVSLERVPVLQKEIIRRANELGSIVITATQMLDSMIFSPNPTRAEASDVANAIFDGTDGVMLSGETATGKYPVESLAVMARIVEEAEKSPLEKAKEWKSPLLKGDESFAQAVVQSACYAAEEVNAKAIIVFSMTGKTCRLISKLKPRKPIIGLTPKLKSYYQLALGWGIHPLISPTGHSTDEMIQKGEQVLLSLKLLKKGDKVVVVSGTQLLRGATNMMKILIL